jgi:hypothetical protein
VAKEPRDPPALPGNITHRGYTSKKVWEPKRLPPGPAPGGARPGVTRPADPK